MTPMPRKVTSRPNVNWNEVEAEMSTRESLSKRSAGGRRGARVGLPEAANSANPIGYRTSMDSPQARACPSCSALTESRQRWCLECGAELPSQRRGALRPAVGVATTLALLVGAASAAGFTVLHDGKQPPPPATTVAQQPPATTPPVPTPPATQEPVTPAPSSTPVPLPATPAPRPRPPRVHTPSTPTTSPSGHVGPSSDGGATATDTTPRTPQLALTDIALGAAAVAYAPYAPQNADLGDPSRIVDGSTRTVWRTPAALTSAGASPQLGVYLDLADKQKIRKVVVRTPTPGMGIELYGAVSGPPDSITDPGWDHLATRENVAGKTTIGLPQRPFRYVLVWITGLPPNSDSAAISEVSLLSLQPE